MTEKTTGKKKRQGETKRERKLGVELQGKKNQHEQGDDIRR